MRRRFRFEYSDAEYGVFGQFGPQHGFSVVHLEAGAGRAATEILTFIPGVESAEQLRREVEKTYPELTGFRPF